MSLFEREADSSQIQDLERQNDRLKRSVQELSLLQEIAGATSSNDSVEETINTIVKKCLEVVRAEQGDVHLLEDQGAGGPLKTVLRRAAASRTMQAARPTDQILGWVLKHKSALRLNDPLRDPRFPGLAKLETPVRSLLSMPLRFRGSFIGLLTLLNAKSPEGFSESDERLLGIIAAQAAPLVRSTIELGALREENSLLRKEVESRFSDESIIGSGPAFQEVMAMARRVRQADIEVLVTGESGTGKELIAKAIHYGSRRSAGPFVELNCAALPDNLVEAELFGIEKGVATGVDQRIGQFEVAQGGTLFLDEIGDLSLTAQAKILRALQERKVQRVGGRATIPIDVRVLAATHRDLVKEAAEGRFREDLLYRLNAIHLKLPALRERAEDVPELANWFLAEQCRELKREPLTISPAAMAKLAGFEWPGNIRQLRNEMRRAAVCAAGPAVEGSDLSEAVAGAREAARPVSDSGAPLEDALAAFEKSVIEDALKAHSDSRTETAKALGISRHGLLKKMKRLGIIEQSQAEA